ncbi:hypothetical protein ACFUTX_02335 [Microbacterium sp. NPDC057407]
MIQAFGLGVLLVLALGFLAFATVILVQFVRIGIQAKQHAEGGADDQD